MPSIAVTGATGVVGGGVARRLAAAGMAQRLVVRSPDGHRALPGARGRAGLLRRPGRAPTPRWPGSTRVFMVSGAEDPNRLADHLTFVDAAVAAGVRRIVYTSFFGAAPDSTFLLARDHWHTEERIRDSAWRSPSCATTSTPTLLLDFAGPEGVLRGPAGDGRIAAVARADVIDAAVAVLTAAAQALDRRDRPRRRRPTG